MIRLFKRYKVDLKLQN